MNKDALKEKISFFKLALTTLIAFFIGCFTCKILDNIKKLED